MPSLLFEKKRGEETDRCLACKRAYDRAWHARRSIEQKRSKSAKQAERVRRNRQFIFDFLKEHPCVDCEESDPVVLQFDHVQDNKSFNISTDGTWVSLKKLKDEMNKCEVRCANCHCRRTAKVFNWYSDLS